MHASQNMAVLTSAEGDGGGGAVRMNSEARILNASSSNDQSGNGNTGGTGSSPEQPQRPQQYNVVIPPGVRPGTSFPVSVNGKKSSNYPVSNK